MFQIVAHKASVTSITLFSSNRDLVSGRELCGQDSAPGYACKSIDPFCLF